MEGAAYITLLIPYQPPNQSVSKKGGSRSFTSFSAIFITFLKFQGGAPPPPHEYTNVSQWN